MILILPKGLNFQVHIANYPLDEYQFKNFRVEVLEYIITLTYTIPANNKELAGRIRDGFVPLNAQLLQKFCGREYMLYLRYLVETGLFECDNFFISSSVSASGAKSRGYRLAKNLRANDVDTKIVADNSLKKHFRKELKQLKSPEYSHLTKWLGYASKLKIDYHTAIKFLELQRDHLIAHPEERDVRRFIEIENGKPVEREEYKDPSSQYFHGRFNVETIDKCPLYSMVDDNIGRFHSPLTNMRSSLRQFVTHGDEPLFSIDLKNSQPYLSNIFFNPSFWSNESEGGEDEKNSDNGCENVSFNTIKSTFHFLLDTKQVRNKKSINKEITPPIILGKIKEEIDNQLFSLNSDIEGDDIEFYQKLTADGTLYEYLQEKFLTRLGKAFKDRSAVKGIIFTVMFTDNRYQNDTKLLFQELFPRVSQVFAAIKKGDRTILPRLLQSIESFLFLRVITKKIAKRYPKAPLYTIHDSIVTTERYVEYVNQVMTEVLTEYVGIPPTLSIEGWSKAYPAADGVEHFGWNSVIASLV